MEQVKVTGITVNGAHKNGRDWRSDQTLTLEDGRQVPFSDGPYRLKREALAAKMSGRMFAHINGAGRVAYTETHYGI